MFVDSIDDAASEWTMRHFSVEWRAGRDAHENAPIRKIVPKGKKENAPIFQNDKK